MIRPTFAGFDAALSALRMNQKKLDIVGQNLANMNTEGYTRQELKTSSLNYENPTSFYMNQNDVNVGFGVAMEGVRQLRDQFLDKQYREQNSRSSYNESIKESLKSLSGFLDESSIDGIRSAFDAIQTSLTNMQDPSKVQDPVYEGELMSRVQALTTLMNSAAESIELAKVNEFYKLNGEGNSENGATQKINQLLSEIGELNQKIKKNQLLGNSALELMDERNLRLDELASYIPIETEKFSESYEVTVGTGSSQKIETRYRIYNYNEAGEVIGRADWPEDLRVKLLYTDKNGIPQTLTLVNGAVDADTRYTIERPTGDGSGRLVESRAGNVGYVEIKTDGKTPAGPLYTSKNPTDTALSFHGARSNAVGSSGNMMSTDNTRFQSGSVQASLDMLSPSRLLKEDGSLNTETTSLRESNQMNYYSFDFYTQKLDYLAKSFAADMNEINKKGNTPVSGAEPENYVLLIDKHASSDKAGLSGITAANIGLAKDWVNGKTHIGTHGFKEGKSLSQQGDTTDTVLEMLEYMTSPKMKTNNTSTSYSDYMNNVSTLLATDSYSNNNAYRINKAVLDAVNTSRDQLSGVSLDEEAANMMTYTASYNAAARLMTALDETLATLLGIGA